MALTRMYRHGVLAGKGFPVADVSDHMADSDCVVWIDLCQPKRAELEEVREELQLHALAIDDAVGARQRPKLDRYESHLFVTAYQVDLDSGSGTLTLHEVAAFVTSRALVTVRKDPGFAIEEVAARWDASPDLAGHGTAFLLYGLLDHVVDSHFDAVQVLDDAIEGLEDLLFADRPANTEVQRRSFQLRKSLVLLRRVVLPMREVVNSLMRRDLGIVDGAMVPYYQDVYDHVLRATEWTESLRDLVSTVLETNLTIQGNRLNSIMKKVTSWAAIIAVPTAVTGFYGQNLPFPGYEHQAGLWSSVALMVALSVGLYAEFRRRDWL